MCESCQPADGCVAQLDQTASERDAGTTRLRWANAGHPPPVVVGADGSVTRLDGAGPDLLLGRDPGCPRTEGVVPLERGATVLLHTDGLVERRGESVEAGLARLDEVLRDRAVRDLPLEQLCDWLLRRLVPDRPEDDVALVAVRLHPQD